MLCYYRLSYPGVYILIQINPPKVWHEHVTSSLFIKQYFKIFIEVFYFDVNVWKVLLLEYNSEYRTCTCNRVFLHCIIAIFVKSNYLSTSFSSV